MILPSQLPEDPVTKAMKDPKVIQTIKVIDDVLDKCGKIRRYCKRDKSPVGDPEVLK